MGVAPFLSKRKKGDPIKLPDPFFAGGPYGIRTCVTGVRGRKHSPNLLLSWGIRVSLI